MKNYSKKRNGFSLLEIVAILTLLGIGLSFGAILFTTLTQNYVASRSAVEKGQDLQAAMNRLIKEFTFSQGSSINITGSTQVQWLSNHPQTANQTNTLFWDGTPGTPLSLNGKSLLDDVAFFEISSSSNFVTLKLRCVGAEAINLTSVIEPRTNY
ncbi:MAG: pilus assembly FimT family protein [Akkermansiaceae bacterium]